MSDYALYVKYNTNRRPVFQTVTYIMKRLNGERYILKRPVSHEALEHVYNMTSNRNVLREMYCNISPVDCVQEKNGVKFEYINGNRIDDGIDYYNDEISILVDKVKQLIDKIFDLKAEYHIPFERTSEFVEVFGEVDLSRVESLATSNLDSIFSNFIEKDGKWYSIDYEWVCKFPVPLFYLKYRVLHYLFVEEQKAAFIARGLGEIEFLDKFNLSKEMVDICEKMEYSFQEYVHGENLEFNYIDKYRGTDIVASEAMEVFIKKESNLLHEIELKENHVQNLESEVMLLEKMNKEKDSAIVELQSSVYMLSAENHNLWRALINPFKAIKMLVQKIKNRGRQNAK